MSSSSEAETTGRDDTWVTTMARRADDETLIRMLCDASEEFARRYRIARRNLAKSVVSTAEGSAKP
jgi:hypothetical protein